MSEDSTHTLLKQIDSKIDKVAHTLADTRDRVMVVEGQQNPEKIAKLTDKVSAAEQRVAKIEVRSGMLVAGVSIFFSSLIGIFLKHWPN